MKKVYSLLMLMLMAAVTASAAAPLSMKKAGALPADVKAINFDGKTVKKAKLPQMKDLKGKKADKNLKSLKKSELAVPAARKAAAPALKFGNAASLKKHDLKQNVLRNANARMAKAAAPARKAVSMADVEGQYSWSYYDLLYDEAGSVSVQIITIEEGGNDVYVYCPDYSMILEAVVDTENATITIPSGQVIEYLEDYDDNLVFNVYASDFATVLPALVGTITDSGIEFDPEACAIAELSQNPDAMLFAWAEMSWAKEKSMSLNDILGEYAWTYIDYFSDEEGECTANVEVYGDPENNQFTVTGFLSNIPMLGEFIPSMKYVGIYSGLEITLNDGSSLYINIYSMDGEDLYEEDYMFGQILEDGSIYFDPSYLAVVQDEEGAYIAWSNNFWGRAQEEEEEEGEPQPVPAGLLGDYEWSFYSAFGEDYDGVYDITLSQSSEAINAVEVSGDFGDYKFLAYTNAEEGTLTIKTGQFLFHDEELDVDYTLECMDAQTGDSKKKIVGTITETGVEFEPYDLLGAALVLGGNQYFDFANYANEWNKVVPDTTVWNTVGDATFIDGYYLSVCEEDHYNTPQNVVLQQDAANENRYRIVNPYAGADYKAYNIDEKKEGAIVFNVADPECVVVEAGVYSGLKDADNGKYYFTNSIGYYMAQGFDFDTVKEALSDEDSIVFSTFEDGVVNIYDGWFGMGAQKVGSYTWIDTDMTGKIIFNNTNGVENLVKDDANAPVEYYNLQGARVANPENGIFIRRQGAKASKVFVK